MKDYANKAAVYAAEKFPPKEREPFVQGALWAIQEVVLDLESRVRALTAENERLRSAAVAACPSYACKPREQAQEKLELPEVPFLPAMEKKPGSLVGNESSGQELPSLQLVAFARKGCLFWHGNPQDWLGTSCNLYALPASKQQVPCDGRKDEVLCRCGPEHRCSACGPQ